MNYLNTNDFIQKYNEASSSFETFTIQIDINLHVIWQEVYIFNKNVRIVFPLKKKYYMNMNAHISNFCIYFI